MIRPSLLRMLRLVLILTMTFFSFVRTVAQYRLTVPSIGVTLDAASTLRDLQGLPGMARFVANPDSTSYGWRYSTSHAPAGIAGAPTMATLVGAGSHIAELPIPLIILLVRRDRCKRDLDRRALARTVAILYDRCHLNDKSEPFK